MESKICWAHFFTCFSPDQDQIDVALKQLKLSILIVLESDFFFHLGK